MASAALRWISTVWVSWLAILLCAGFVPCPANAEEMPPALLIETGGHTSGTLEAATDAEGRILVTASDDRTARVWSLPDLRPLQVLRPPILSGEGIGLSAVAVSPDGRFAAIEGQGATGDEHRVLIFDLATADIAHIIAHLPSSVLSLAYARDGSALAAGFNDGQGLKVWNTATWTERFSDTAYQEGLYALAYGPEGRLAAAALDGMLHLYGASGTLEARDKLRVGQLPVRAAFSPDGASVVVVFEDATDLEIRDGRTLAEKARPDMAGLDGPMARAAFGRDGTLYASGDPIVRGTRPVFAWGGQGAGPRRIAFTGFASGEGIFGIRPLPDGGMVLTSEMGALLSYSQYSALRAAQPTLAQQLTTGFEISNPTRRFLLSPDGAEIAWAATDRRLVWQKFDARMLQLALPGAEPAGLRDWTSEAGPLQVSDWDNGSQPKLNGRTLALDHHEIARAVSVAPGRIVLGTAWNLRQFDANGVQRWVRRVTGEVWRVNQSLDCRLVVAAGGDGTLRWFRAEDGADVLTLFVTTDGRWVAWTPSGYYAASASGDDLIGWQVNRGPDHAPDFFPASQFQDEYLRPDIVQRVLTSASEADARRDADAARGVASRPPRPVTADLPPVLSAGVRRADHAGPGNRPENGRVIAFTVRSPPDRAVRAVHVCVRLIPLRDCVARDDAVLNGSGGGEIAVDLGAGMIAEVRLQATTETRVSRPVLVRIGEAAR
jgi:WD40 repeat protein